MTDAAAAGAARTGALEARGLTVTYPGADRRALEGVTMRVDGGVLYAVLGPNGSGKSTLMKALLGRVTPENGRALVEGRDVADWDRKELARRVGAVPQAEFVTFPITARQLIGMGRYPHLGPLAREGPEDRRAIEAAMVQCDVQAFRDRDVATLSGGEAQRVRIARALAQEPRILALDEPTSSLDIQHEMAILGLLRRAVDGGMTVMLVTHHLEVAGRFADRMLLLSGGRVEAEGPPAEVLTGAVLSRVYQWPIEVEIDDDRGFPRITPT